MLRRFQLEHPESEMVLCGRPKCEAIAIQSALSSLRSTSASHRYRLRVQKAAA